MNERGPHFNPEFHPVEPVQSEQSRDIARPQESLAKYEIELPNLNELFDSGMATLEVKANGEPVKFDQLVVTIDEVVPGEPTTAEVVFIEKSNREEHKGIGIPLYVKLGQELLKKGVTLTSSSVQYGPGRDLWQKLASLGYAEKNGPTFRFKNRE